MHGIGLRRRHYQHLLDHGPGDVEFFEIISEDFFADGGRPWHVLEQLRRDRPVVMHGVSMGIGDAGDLSQSYLQSLDRVIARVDPAWVSDHICWVSSEGRYGHELWPLPYDDSTLDHLVSKIAKAQDRLGRRLSFENPSRYTSFDRDAIDEAQFLNELARRSGCGLLLDLNNVYVSSINLGFDASAYIDAMDADAITQIHLAGHTDCGDFLMDTHVGPTPDPVVALYRRFSARRADVPTLIEWDTDVPEYEMVAAEAARMRAYV